jgi:hypothetical protein
VYVQKGRKTKLVSLHEASEEKFFTWVRVRREEQWMTEGDSECLVFKKGNFPHDFSLFAGGFTGKLEVFHLHYRVIN